MLCIPTLCEAVTKKCMGLIYTLKGGDTVKNKILEPVLVFVLILVTLFNMVGLAVEAFGYDTTELPKGEFLYSVMSPDSKHTLRLYLVEIENVNTAIRGEVVSLKEDGTMESRNVYWEVGTKNAIAGWINEETVSINNREVKLSGEPFDSRKQIELPEASAKNRAMNNSSK